jgi:hypothetical protein
MDRARRLTHRVSLLPQVRSLAFLLKAKAQHSRNHGLRALLQEHRALGAVLLVGLLLRLAVEIAYWPGLFYGDSWGYLDDAYAGFPAGFEPVRPSGYPALLRVMMIPGRQIGIVTIVQHLAGLVTIVVAYALMVRCGVRRSWAAAVGALLSLDAWTLALEQRLLAETFFTLAIVVALYLAISAERRWWMILAAAALLGASSTLRTVGIFAIPVLLAYLAWEHRNLRAPLVAACAALAPILLYASAHAAVLGTFRLTDASGWFLYARVAQIADCSKSSVAPEARFLCQPKHDPSRHRGVAHYLWDADAPAQRRLGAVGQDPHANELLGSFARTVIRDQPGDYIGMVSADVGRFFVPGEHSLARSDEALVLPGQPGEAFFDDPAHKRLLPDYKPPARAPAGALHAYSQVVHVPRPLLSLAAILALVSFVVGIVEPSRVPHRKQAFLLVGTGLAFVIGAAATSDFVLRYLLPSAPLLLAAGAISASDLLQRQRQASSLARAAA